jgi:hypothetical protein
MRPRNAGLLVAGLYGASLAASFLLLVAGAIAAGSAGASRAETVLLAVLGASAFVYALGAAAAYFVLRRAGLTVGARLAVLLGYGLIVLFSLVALFLVGALVFNR